MSTLGEPEPPAPKLGDRVHVEFDATVILDVTRMPGCVALKPDHPVPSETGWVYAAVKHCTVIAPLLRLHEVIPAGAPEPPASSVVMDGNGTSWQRTGSTWWGRGTPRAWGALGWTPPLTLLWMPEVTL